MKDTFKKEIQQIYLESIAKFTQYCIDNLLIPKTKFQKFVHFCDYLALRRYLDFEKT